MKLPKISEEELKRKLAKAIEQGTKDWADVPDATQWVEQIRGHEDGKEEREERRENESRT